MNCKDFETSIYLYTELSEKDKELLDSHLLTCHGCAALFEEVKQMQGIIAQVAGKEEIPGNAARLTSNIMSKITSNKQGSAFPLIDLFFMRARFVMTVLSMSLLISFAVEFLNDTPPPAETKVMAGTHILLIGKAFRQNFIATRRERLFADCRSPFQSGKEYLNCVKSKLK